MGMLYTHTDGYYPSYHCFLLCVVSLSRTVIRGCLVPNKLELIELENVRPRCFLEVCLFCF